MIALLLAVHIGWAGEGDDLVAIRFGPEGLAGITYGGDDYLKTGAIGATWNDEVVLRAADGTLVPGDVAHGVLQVDSGTSTVIRRYGWGSVQCAYRPSANRLSLDITISNDGMQTIASVQLQVLELEFPSALTEYDGNTPMIATNIGAPSVLVASHAHGVTVLVNEDLERGLSLGYPWANDRPTSRCFPLWADTGRRAKLPESHPTIDRPIPPGGTDHYHLSLRFAPTGTPPAMLVQDITKRFQDAHPATLSWPDRRPIGMLMLSSTVPHHALNPRGWFLNDPDIDTTTEGGRHHFAERLTAYAAKSVEVLKRMGAQGVIIWDCEGQEFPHATSYIGDPRRLPPEMAPLADAFFKTFTDAGLKTGVCIRPQRPMVNVYAQQAQQMEVPISDELSVLSDKIAYVTKRWGCSLFYVDSNVDREHRADGPIDSDVFRRLAAAFPSVLLIPEQKTAAYWACTAPYAELRGGVASTPESVRLLYPHSFSVIAVNDGPLDKRHGDLVAAVARGDILMFRSWWDDPEQPAVNSIYRDAGR
jgi:hypothetical protein